MKFMSSFQCLMGGNAVQFHDHASSSSVSPTAQSSVVLVNDNDRKKSSSSVITKKKKKIKKKKQKQDDRKVIKVFKPNGEINLYKKPVKVSEVMTEEYMVCRSDSFYIGQKIPPLSYDDRLQRGHTYFLLPSHLFHTVLSFVTIASFTASSKLQNVDDSNNANLKMKAAFLKKAAASSCSPFDIQKSPSGTLRIRVSELFILQLMTDQAVASCDDDQLTSLCTTPHLHREYKQLVIGSRRGWKPKLEMIKEIPPKGKRKVKMLLSASINRMKKKMKKTKKTGIPPVSTSSSSSSSSSSASSSKKKKKLKKTKKNTKATVAQSSLSASHLKENKYSNTKETPVGIR